MKRSTRSIVLGVSGAAVAAAVALGIGFLGSPAEERERRVDDRRLADLHEITAAADLYWTRHGRLPASLDDLAAEPGLNISTRDPTSSEMYEYRALDDGRYEVCATFATDSGGGNGKLLDRSEELSGLPRPGLAHCGPPRRSGGRARRVSGRVGARRGAALLPDARSVRRRPGCRPPPLRIAFVHAERDAAFRDRRAGDVQPLRVGMT